MSGKYHGKNTRFYIGGYDISSLMASVDWSDEVEMAQYAVGDGSNAYHSMPGYIKGGLKLDGIFDDNYMSQLNALLTAATGYRLMIPLGSTVGDAVLCLNEAKLKKPAWKTIITDINKVSYEFVDEALPVDVCKLLFAKTQETSDGNGSTLDNGATSSNGLVAHLQVFECGADDALIVKVQSDDNSGFTSPTDLITFTTANGITSERKTASGTIERYLRVSWSGTPTYQSTFAVAIKR